jgi:hypothetical protein
MKFEYKKIYESLNEEELNVLGTKGWELVSLVKILIDKQPTENHGVFETQYHF